MENRKLKYKFTRNIFKKASSARDLQKTEMSCHLVLSCKIGCC